MGQEMCMQLEQSSGGYRVTVDRPGTGRQVLDLVDELEKDLLVKLLTVPGASSRSITIRQV